MSSILTNNGAMVALQTLRATNNNMTEVQNQIATGKRVSTAKDDAANWAIATTMSSDISSLTRLSKSLDSSEQMLAVASNASEQIVEQIKGAQELVVQRQNVATGTQEYTDINAKLTKIGETIGSIATSAQYNGTNLIHGADTSKAATNQNITVSIKRATDGTVSSEAMTVTGENVLAEMFNILQNRTAGEADYTDVATFAAAIVQGTGGDGDNKAQLDNLDRALDYMKSVATSFGSARARIESQNEFLKGQADALKMGVGALVDADMEEASARLQALQVQQQLGTQALSIANQAPQNLLSLFR
ncbi:flagellin [Paracoccaceae bacterium GXU_MW_L88]